MDCQILATQYTTMQRGGPMSCSLYAYTYTLSNRPTHHSKFESPAHRQREGEQVQNDIWYLLARPDILNTDDALAYRTAEYKHHVNCNNLVIIICLITINTTSVTHNVTWKCLDSSLSWTTKQAIPHFFLSSSLTVKMQDGRAPKYVGNVHFDKSLTLHCLRIKNRAPAAIQVRLLALWELYSNCF